jgi:XTP/dITP diphosphohydrolase
MKVIFASHNENKVAEIRKLLPATIELLSLKEIGFLEDIPETGLTLEDNSKIKAETIFLHTKTATIADDTGLEVTALNNAPGVYSARYAGGPKSDKRNMQKLLENLSNVSSREARFRTVFTFMNNDLMQQFEGTVEGRITDTPKGEFGFGYDPVFCPENEKRTFAEMSMEEKNNMSHRARALAKMILFLNQNHEKL